MNNTNRLNKMLVNLGRTQLPAVRFMTLSDMMHDGLRAVVLRGMVALDSHDEESLKEVKEEYSEFSKNIVQNLDEIMKIDVSAEVKADITGAMPEVNAYVKSGGEVLDFVYQGKSKEALARLPEYQKTFKALEEKFEKLGDKIEEQAKLSVTESESAAERAKKIGLFIAGLGVALMVLLSALMNRSLSSSLESVVLGLKKQGESLQGFMHQVDQSSQRLSFRCSR